MFRTAFLALWLGLAILILQSAAAAQQAPPIERWVPREAIVTIELSQPKAVLDLALDPDLLKAITSSPTYQAQASKPDLKGIFDLVKHLENRFGANWQTILHKLVDGGIAFGVGPKGTIVLSIDATDGRMLQGMHDVFRDIAKGEAEKAGDPERVVSKEYGGATGWTFDGTEAHTIIGSRFLWANNVEVLKAVLDLRAKPGLRSLASSPKYQAAKRAAGPGSVGRAFVDLGTLKQAPGVQKLLAPGGNPLAVLLLAGVQESVRESTWLGVGLDVRKDAISLRATVDGKPTGSGPASFIEPRQPGKGALPNLTVPRRIAAVSLYRDLHKFYAAKDELFPQRTSELIFFENMMGIFFSGRDLTDEVLAEIEPEIRLVAAEQAYDPTAGTPEVQIPAFAVVVRMRNPKKFAAAVEQTWGDDKKFGVVVEEAWQKAIGLVNFTRGQKAMPGLIIDRVSHGGTKLTVAYFSAADEKDKRALDIRFNLRPTLARFGDHLILSSTDQLAKDLIDALGKEAAKAAKPLPGVHTIVELDSVRLATTLGANRENLIRQNMLDDGNTRAEAETFVDTLLNVLEYVGQARLIVGTRNGQSCARIDLWPNLP